MNTSCAELRAQSERAVREMKSVEEELERVRREPLDETRRLTEEMVELRKRVLLAENERHEALNKATSAAVSEKKWSGQWNKEKLQLTSEMSELQRKLQRQGKEIGTDVRFSKLIAAIFNEKASCAELQRCTHGKKHLKL